MKKIAVAAIIIFCIAIATFTIAQDAQAQTDWEQSREVITITVRSGDSIDGYWAQYAPSWMSREQYRYEIKALNDMDSCTIYVGQSIMLYCQPQQYTVEGWCFNNIITTLDGNQWIYDNAENGCAYVTFSDNGTADITDDIIVSISLMRGGN